ncbi:MAG: CHASE2 domain-containing protein, partial [Betaproteobacteria bacterium]|nr:CHASE2 domain-containing protein [Betaproteobacteria bacterium]
MDTAQMRQFSWLAVGAGLLTTVVVLIASILGLFRDLELSTADWRYQHVRGQPVALSSDIALVALDDSALDTYGRWPWPRERFAEVIDELRNLGAKTLALDIQFTESEVGNCGQAGEGDRKLGEALQSPHVNSVIGLDAGQQWPERERVLWLTPEGAEKQTKIIELLTNDLSAEPADVAAKVSLSDSLATDLKRHYTWFKSLAIWQYIWSSYSKSQELPQAIDVRKAMNVRGAS